MEEIHLFQLPYEFYVKLNPEFSKDLSEATRSSIRRTNKILKKLQERNLIVQINHSLRNRKFTIDKQFDFKF